MDTDLFRGGAGDLRTSGDFTAANIHVGEGGLVDGVRVSALKSDHDKLAAAAVQYADECVDDGVLRWHDDTLQVCSGAKAGWVTTGGGSEADEVALLERAAAPARTDGAGKLYYKSSVSFKAGSPLAQGLVAYFALDGNYQDAVGDNHGVPSDTLVSTTGKVGAATYFDGSGDYVQCGSRDDPDFDFASTNAFTASAWVKLEDSSTFHYIVNTEHGCGGDDVGWSLAANRINDKTYGIFAGYSGGPAAAHGADNKCVGGCWPTARACAKGDNTCVLRFHQWTFVVRTMDAADQRIYIDGVLRATERRPKDDKFTNGHDVVIGGYSKIGGCGGRYARGVIDEVGLWNRRLLDAEVKALYNEGPS